MQRLARDMSRAPRIASSLFASSSGMTGGFAPLAPSSSSLLPGSLLQTRAPHTWGDPNWSKARHGPYGLSSLKQAGQNARTLAEQFEFIEKHCVKHFHNVKIAPGVVPVAAYKHGQWVRMFRIARKNVRYRSLPGAPGGGRILLAAIRDGRLKGMSPKNPYTRRWRMELHRILFREAQQFVVKWNTRINKVLVEETIRDKKNAFRGWMAEWYKKKAAEAAARGEEFSFYLPTPGGIARVLTEREDLDYPMVKDVLGARRGKADGAGGR